MSVIHVVQFKFKPGIDEQTIRRTCDDVLNLKDKAVHPTTKKPYIKSVSGGRDHSIEGLQNGFTHVFVMEFENEQDRNFYVEQDEAHLAVVASLGALVDGSQVLDYTPGKF
ncbi:MAG: hypothetical protein HETSPECPRED_009095 [Heterodermia speciosa]|uniref:Stress-response A/B barrel domain-containing protein n=1 Tax=Heterodermia speciosa TaxID=116794 RepID=A0A8H3G3S0_9LECA|nr:MAG: hypothetical protein HETSPECPRED_009095 [Heterodermia speciosa]